MGGNHSGDSLPAGCHKGAVHANLVQTPACLLAYDSVIIRHKDRELGKDRGIWQNLVSQSQVKGNCKTGTTAGRTLYPNVAVHHPGYVAGDSHTQAGSLNTPDSFILSSFKRLKDALYEFRRYSHPVVLTYQPVGAVTLLRTACF